MKSQTDISAEIRALTTEVGASACGILPAEIRALAAEVGASACGILPAEPVDDAADALYHRWIADGRHGSMDYCARYQDLRSDPRLLLDGARTLIVCAFSYYNPGASTDWAEGRPRPVQRPEVIPPEPCASTDWAEGRPRPVQRPEVIPPEPCASTDWAEGRPRPVQRPLRISRYAWGKDYHHVLKERLRRLAALLTERHGGECRVMVDTAPIRERYWAQRTGVGFIGLNNQLIVPGIGSYVFLGEILWTHPIAYQVAQASSLCTHPSPSNLCASCMACVKACPGHALDGKGGCDARRCISYLTIEHRGDLPADARLAGNCYGCDICQQVCPHNASAAPTTIPEFAPDPTILSLTEADVRQMTPSHFRRLTRHSAMSRISLPQLLRNLDHR